MHKSRKYLGLVAFLACALAGLGQARAETKAWAAAKAAIPSDAAFVVGLNLNQFRSSALFQTLFKQFTGQSAEFTKATKTLKTACKLDLVKVVDSVVVAMADPNADDKNGAIYIGLNGLNEAKLSKCIVALAKKIDKSKVKVAKADGYVMYDNGKGEIIYTKWVSKDTVAVALNPEDKDLLGRYTGKGALSADVTKAVGGVKADAALWLVYAKSQPVPNAGTMKSAYGSIELASGNVNVDGHLLMASAAEAKKLSDMANQQLKQAAGSLPADLVSAIKIASAGSEVTIKVSLTEKKIEELVNQFLGQMMGGGGSKTP